MVKIAVVTDKEVSTYFKAAGVKLSYTAKDPSEANALISSLAKRPEVGVIVVTEKVAEDARGVIETISKRLSPTIITIPGLQGPSGEKISPILELVKRTLGVEVKV